MVLTEENSPWSVALILCSVVVGCGGGTPAHEVPEESSDVVTDSGVGNPPRIEGDALPSSTAESESNEDEVDRAAIEATKLSVVDLAREVRLEPNPAASPLAPDPVPFTLRQEIIDQARLRSHRSLSSEALHRLVRGNQFTFRAMACDRAATSDDARLIPVLIDALSDESMHDGARYPSDSGLWTTRKRCHRALQQMTGESFGFLWNAPQDQRRQAIERWQSWYLESRPR